MELEQGSTGDPKILNLMQIVVLNMVASCAVLVALLSFGTSLWISLGIAWIGGATVTLALALLVTLFWERFVVRNARRDDARRVSGPALVPSNITDSLQLWEADRLMEIDHAAGLGDRTATAASRAPDGGGTRDQQETGPDVKRRARG